LEVRVKVLFFGQLKDLAGMAEDTIEVPEGTSLEGIFDYYAGRVPGLPGLRKSTVMARNHQFAGPSTPIAHGDEIAFLPPVSGGSSPFTREIVDPAGHFFALTRLPIETRLLQHRLVAGTDGAVVVFEGVVRNNTAGRPTKFLDYEGYESMAVETMARIGLEIASDHQIGRIAMVHRLGRMEIGDASVVIIVTAPHRKPAFEAALEGINRLKKLVPIWKKEHFEDGEVWVDGDWDSSVLQL
jgi:molybdopterin synthase catalytic subunit